MKKWRATPKKIRSSHPPLSQLWWRHIAHACQGRENCNDIDRPLNFDISWSRRYEDRLTHAESLAVCGLVTVQGQNDWGSVPIIGSVVVCSVQIGRAPSLWLTCYRGWNGKVVRFPLPTAWVKNVWSCTSTRTRLAGVLHKYTRQLWIASRCFGWNYSPCVFSRGNTF